MNTTAKRARQRSGRQDGTEFRLMVNSADCRQELRVVRGRGDDYFVIAPDARVVAALVVLDKARGLA